MKTNEAQNKIEAKLAGLGIIELSNLLIEAAKDLSDAAGLVLEIGMNVMESKMSQEDFVKFCGQLEAAQ